MRKTWTKASLSTGTTSDSAWSGVKAVPWKNTPCRLELIQPHHPKAEDFGDCGSITHIGLGVHDIDTVVAELRTKGMKFLSEEIEDKDEPLGGLRAIQLLGPADEHINLYEWKGEI